VRAIKIFVGILVLGGVALVLFISLAGIELILENQSGQNVKEVNISYGRGSLLVESISDKEIYKKSLGKIGEGATFNVRWRDGSGINRQVNFTVYFDDFGGNNRIRIRLLPDGEAVLFHGERQHKPNKP
jgi:hypothetical protein